MKFLLFHLFFFSSLFAKSYIIGISGASGSGKTTLTNELKEILQEKASIIRQDNYYHDLSHLAPSQRKKQNFDIPEAIDFTALKKNLIALKNGKPAYEPVYDFTINSRTKEMNKIKSCPVIIVEGTLVFCSKEIRDLFDLMIYVDTPLDLCLSRRLSRDLCERDISILESQKQYESQVRPGYFKHILPCKEFSHLVIPNHHLDQEQRKKITKNLFTLLK